MPISIGYDFKCPYCNMETRMYHELKISAGVVPLYIDPFITHCDVDEGGCDKMVAVKLKPSMEFTGRRIEGEDKCLCFTEASKEGEEKPPDVDTRQLDLFQDVIAGELELPATPPMGHAV